MKKITLMLAAASLLFAACSKNDSTTATLTPSQKILGAWMKTTDQKITTVGTGTPQTEDKLAGASSCRKDDLYNFLNNSILVRTEGATKCDPQTDPDTVANGKGMYSLYSNDTKLIWNLQGLMDTFDIVTFNTTTLSLKSTDTGSVGGSNVTISNVLTFTKK